MLWSSLSIHSMTSNSKLLNEPFQIHVHTLAGVAQVDQASSSKPKSDGFDSWSQYMPGLWVQSLVGVYARCNQSVFLSHIDDSLPLFLPPFSSLESIKEKN